MVSTSRLLRISYCTPPDQFIMYGMRILGSIHEALRLEKLVPTNGALPSGATLKGTAPGPCDSAKAGRGSPTGACTAAEARYSSKFWPNDVMNKSCRMIPKFDRKTSLGRKF